MSSNERLWDGHWVLGRDATPMTGIDQLPPAAQPAVLALIGDIPDDTSRVIESQIALPLASGGHALLTIRGLPRHLEVMVRGAGTRPDPHPGDPVVATLEDGRRAVLPGIAVCAIGPDGETSMVSPALAALVRTPARTLATRGLESIVSPDDAGRLAALVRRAEDVAEGIALVPGDGGPTRWVNVEAVDLDADPLTFPAAAAPDHGRLLVFTPLDAPGGRMASAARRANALFEQAPSGRCQLDEEGAIRRANTTFADLVGTPADELTGRHLIDLVARDDQAPLQALLGATLGGDLSGFEHEVRLADDEPSTASARWVRITIEGATLAGAIVADAVLVDITDRHRAEIDQLGTVDALRTAFTHAPTPMALVSRDGTIREANAELRDLLALVSDGPPVARLVEMVAEDDRAAVDQALLDVFDGEGGQGEGGQLECRLLRAGRPDGLVELVVSPVPSSADPGAFAIAQLRDITVQRDTEEKLLHQTLHDPLTGLGNRLLLRERLERATAHPGASFALMFVDLDHFKWTNDTHGHEVGDALLVEIAQRLRNAVRTDDTVVRLGGDEFVVLANGVSEPETAAMLAEKVRAAIAQPFVRSDHVLAVTASVGVVLSGAEHATVDAVLRDADQAMYQAKAAGRDRYQVTVGAGTDQPLTPITEALRLAIDTDSLTVHHQPIVDLRSGRAVGTEALLRIEDPLAGTGPPGRLLDGVEDPELLVDLAGWVLETVLTEVQEWDAAMIGPLSIWLNLSGAELRTDALVDRIGTALDESGLEPHRLHLEIPEPALLLTDGQAQDRMRALTAMGVRLGIDDFGTGTTSLAHLRSMPINFLKIDPSIGRRLLEPGGRAVVEAVVAVGRALGLDVIAEGIEDSAQIDTLVRIGCTHGQGYLFAAPAPAADLTRLEAVYRHDPNHH
ncbi:MAG: EAL domain-containing protein [Acidimicrobiales bacterium]|nr:EAL domain-containing protein [Acidimicrobiales bacterium]